MMPDELKSPRMGAPCDPAPLYVVGDPNGSGRSILTKAGRFREKRIVGPPPTRSRAESLPRIPNLSSAPTSVVHSGLPKTWTGGTLDARSGSAGESPSPRQPPGSTRNNSKRNTSSPH